jgi:hypothetical protein
MQLNCQDVGARCSGVTKEQDGIARDQSYRGYEKNKKAELLEAEPVAGKQIIVR